MFSNLFELRKDRTADGAVGFYLTYTVLFFTLEAFVGLVAGFLAGDASAQTIDGARDIASAITPVVSLLLTLSIVWAKGKEHNFTCLFLAVLSGLTALLGGPFLAALIPAFATLITREAIPAMIKSPILPAAQPIYEPMVRPELFPSLSQNPQLH